MRNRDAGAAEPLEGREDDDGEAEDLGGGEGPEEQQAEEDADEILELDQQEALRNERCALRAYTQHSPVQAKVQTQGCSTHERSPCVLCRLLACLSETQLERYEAYRRSKLKGASMRKVCVCRLALYSPHKNRQGTYPCLLPVRERRYDA